MKIKIPRRLRFRVMRGSVLGVDVLRGFAPLRDLALMSRADVYDEKLNPTGTQRDLSPKHAREAYDYVKNRTLAYWPEVFLCARERKAITFVPDPTEPSVGMLIVNLSYIESNKGISISRIDGNHRLHYADGKEEGFPAIEREAAFCLAIGVSKDSEISLFRDINDNQRRMNTSHLDNIQVRLTPEQQLIAKDPALFIAQKLGRDEGSSLFKRVWEGGAKRATSFVPLRGLKTGITYMFSRPTKLTALNDATAQYKVVRNFFEAVKLWIPEAWEHPKDYIALRGAGLWGLCFLGADVIDRTLGKGSFSVEDMLTILNSGPKWDWSNKGSFQGFSGRGGAVKISEKVSAEFREDGAVSVKALYRKIMSQE